MFTLVASQSRLLETDEQIEVCLTNTITNSLIVARIVYGGLIEYEFEWKQ